MLWEYGSSGFRNMLVKVIPYMQKFKHHQKWFNIAKILVLGICCVKIRKLLSFFVVVMGSVHVHKCMANGKELKKIRTICIEK